MTNAELIAWQNRVQLPIEKALRRAFSLGQTYWQQADSDSYKQNKLSDGTREKFEELVAELIAAEAAAPPAPSEPIKSSYPGIPDTSFDSAAPSEPARDGWKLVPAEPREAMLRAARDWSFFRYGKPIKYEAAEGCWKAMLKAAPPLPAPKETP